MTDPNPICTSYNVHHDCGLPLGHGGDHHCFASNCNAFWVDPPIASDSVSISLSVQEAKVLAACVSRLSAEGILRGTVADRLARLLLVLTIGPAASGNVPAAGWDGFLTKGLTNAN